MRLNKLSFISVFKNAAFWGIVIVVLFHLSSYILDLNSLKYRPLVIYSLYPAAFICLVAGIVQIILKIKKRAVKAAVAVSSLLLFIVIMFFPTYYMVFGYTARREYVIEKNDYKMVAYVVSFLRTDMIYYDYKNAFVRGSKLRLYEDYGEGAFDPVKNNNKEVIQQTWYDDNGNLIMPSE